MTSPTLQQFESQLEQFEYACHHSASLSDLLNRLRTAASVIAPLRQVKAAVVEGAKLICVGDELSESDRKELTAAFASLQSQQRPDSAYLSGCSMLLTRALSREHRLIVQFCAEQDLHDNTLLVDAARTLTDCFAMAVNRDLASNLYQRLQDRELAGSFLREVFASGTFEQCAHTIADLGAGLLGDGRVTVIASDSERLEVVAITGVHTPNRTADAVQQIEIIARLVIEFQHTGRWVETRAANPAVGYAKQLSWFAMNGIRAIRLEQLQSKSDRHKSGRRVYVMIEIFDGQLCPTDNRVEFLMAQAALAVDSFQNTTSTNLYFAWLRSARLRAVLAAFLVALLLILVPSDFEVEVSGQIFPVQRYRVFAPDDGIVEMLSVNADETVTAGQFLLHLQNPERVLERSRLLGEIDSTSSRLQAIRATRSSNGSTPGNQNNRGVDLSSEEQQLEQKLNSLREEQSLVDQQIKSLSLQSPIAGVVYQRRLKERLESRPVQRGQLLMEIVNSKANWQLELQVPENIVGYVRNSIDRNGVIQPNSTTTTANENVVGQAVRFWLSSQQSRTFQTSIDSLEQSAHVNDQRLTCMATAPCFNMDTEQLRPGQLVTARIHCGRRSLGFVLFREVIEYLQKKRFAWL